MPGMRSFGFSLPELVMILVIIGVLAVFALPRLDSRTFDERGFHDGVKSAVQFARKMAVASRRYTCVTVTPGTGSAGKVGVSRDLNDPDQSTPAVSCTSATSLPAPGSVSGCASNEMCAPATITLGGTSFFFDPLGRPVAANKTVLAGAVTLTVTGQPDITIEPETGLVR